LLGAFRDSYRIELNVACLPRPRYLQWNSGVGVAELLYERVQVGDPLTTERRDQITLPQACVIRRSSRIYALYDDLIWVAVVDHDSVLIERIVVHDALC
jgi:hypothetical protein